MEELLHTVSHFTTSLMLVYSLLLWIRNKNDFSQKVLVVTMLVRNALAWIMILGGYGKVDLSYNVLEPGMIVGGFFMATSFFFYPFAAVYPEKFNWKSVLFVFVPFLVVLGIVKTWESGGMIFRQLHSFTDLCRYIDEPDVRNRLLLAISCHFYPVWTIIMSLQAVRNNHPKSEVLKVYGYGMIGMVVVFSTMMIFSAKMGAIMQQIWVNLFFTVITYKLVFEEHIVKRKRIILPKSNNGEREELTLFGQLEKVMREQKPYIHPELTLPELATLVGTNRTSLSASVREQGFKSIQDYLNQYRIREFKKQVEEGNLLPLDELSLCVGFGSKRTFFRCFRDYEGVTPMEYIRQNS